MRGRGGAAYLRGRAVLSFLAALWVLLAAPSADASRPVYDERLSNGLRVLVSPNPNSADVTVLVRYETGSRDEPTGLEGLAHLVEHVMFTGSEHVPPSEYFRLLEAAGATDINGRTSTDDTRYFETLPPERLALALWLESDRMGYLLERADEAALGRARASVLNEWRLRTNGSRFWDLVLAQIFPAGHPLRHMTIGGRASIERATLADVRAFHRTWYGPANATLVIAGRVDPSAALELVRRYFGSLPANPPPVRPPVPPPSPRAPVAIRGEEVSPVASVYLSWLTPPQRAPGEDEIRIVADILRGATWLGRLSRPGSPGPASLRGAPVCTSTQVEEHASALSSELSVTCAGAPRRTPEEILTAVRATFARVPAEITDADVARAKREVVNDRAFALDTSRGWAEALADQAQRGPLPAAYDGGLGRYAAITPDAVRAAARTWLGAPRVIVLTRPAPLLGRLLDVKETTW